MLTLVVDAMEDHNVATVNIPNVLVQTDLPTDDPKAKQAIMKMRGKLAPLVVQADPHVCQKCMTMEKRQPVPCAESSKALHGSLKSVLLFYKKFVKDIKEIGFEINPHDPCVANRMVNGKQQTTV